MANEGQSNSLNEKTFKKFIAFLTANKRNSIRNVAIAELAYRTGSRVGSIAQLELDDILDADGELLEIVVLRKAIVKGNKTTRIFLTHPRVREALYNWLEIRPNVEGIESVFVTQKGTAYTPQALSEVFQDLFVRAKLHGASFHGFRRGFASNVMRKSKANLSVLKTLMNHSNIETTARYVDTMDDVLMDIVEKAS